MEPIGIREDLGPTQRTVPSLAFCHARNSLPTTRVEVVVLRARTYTGYFHRRGDDVMRVFLSSNRKDTHQMYAHGLMGTSTGQLPASLAI